MVDLSVGTMLGGVSTMQFGYKWAFIANALSFVFSAFAIWKLKSPTGHFRAARTVAARNTAQGSSSGMSSTKVCGTCDGRRWFWRSGWREWDGRRGGGAAQILFTLFGEVVFNRGAAGIGLIWGFAGIGLVIGGVIRALDRESD